MEENGSCVGCRKVVKACRVRLSTPVSGLGISPNQFPQGRLIPPTQIVSRSALPSTPVVAEIPTEITPPSLIGPTHDKPLLLWHSTTF